MIKFIYYIFFDIKASFFFKVKYFLEKIIKYPIIIINKIFKLNIKLPYLFKKDFIIENWDWKFVVKAKSWNDYMISTANEYNFREYFLKINEWKIFLDIGSHIWKWSVMLVNKKNITSYCFEPNPETFKYLKENIDLNNLSNKVFPFNYWISNIEWKMNFHMHPQSAMSWLISVSDLDKFEKNNVVNVKIIDIDTFICANNLQINNIDLVKIDVEGFEENVIDWMKKLLMNCSDNLKIICEITSSDKNKIIEKICSYWFNYKPIWEQDFYFFKNNFYEK
ncbi:MAG: FkbM family methyltransferase [uncultured bacterium (gcode 4)]|uniref:FkbM family methyltransferase n=1 Tax=uncultured bacterium (gcode 4) TaxID=1234023 RepID=K2F4H4_9BACT|nr:MAG: FkbM family methyltransferase [uncultured bacterium (gcode 4)]